MYNPNQRSPYMTGLRLGGYWLCRLLRAVSEIMIEFYWSANLQVTGQSIWLSENTDPSKTLPCRQARVWFEREIINPNTLPNYLQRNAAKWCQSSWNPPLHSFSSRHSRFPQAAENINLPSSWEIYPHSLLSSQAIKIHSNQFLCSRNYKTLRSGVVLESIKGASMKGKELSIGNSGFV